MLKKETLFFFFLSVDHDDVPSQLLTELKCDDERHGKHQQLALVDFCRQLDKRRF